MAVYKSSRPTKDGRQYFFRIKYKDIFGNNHDYSSQKYLTKKEAINEEAEYRINISNKKINITNITFEDGFYEWFNDIKEDLKKQSQISVLNKYKHLNNIKKIKINDLVLDHIKIIKSELDEKELSITYKNKILDIIINTIKFCNSNHNTSDTILKHIKKYSDKNTIKKEMDFYTYDEFKKFISVIEDNNWITFFKILYFMGLRQGETQALTWNDINFDKKELKINKTLTSKIKGENWTISSPKTKNSIRILPLSKKVLDGLILLYNDAQKYKDFSKDWFVFGNTIPFKENTIQNHKNKYCDLVGLKRIRIHDFRHSCASYLINKGASITLVSKYLGHSKSSITLDVYTHFYKSELIEIVNEIDKED